MTTKEGTKTDRLTTEERAERNRVEKRLGRTMVEYDITLHKVDVLKGRIVRMLSTLKGYE